MNKELDEITIVLISYKSADKIKKFIKKIPLKVKIIIIDNSKDYSLKKKINRKNIRIYYKKNSGYGSSINYAAKKINTKYFFVIQPDVIGVNEKALTNFHKYANIINDKFSVIGPHFVNASKSGHYQTNLKYKIKKIHNVHGSTMFFNKKTYKLIKGFDENIFLYWEETDYTKRGLKKGYNAYQLNIVKVKHEKGKAVKTNTNQEKIDLENLYTWHFIWSKYYFFSKHFGKIFSLIYFTPILIRIIFRVLLYKNNDKKKYKKYSFRWNGLIKSILMKKSSMRLKSDEFLRI